ncbi:HET-domain-containing protein, partial [Karstenula rhodostoma CBS 690.94]
MRLLQLQSDGGVKFAEIYGDIPAYAILSHTWGADADEVIYQDIITDRGVGKSGYQKIRFCVEKAANDGLKYFWIDTCCIDKSSSAELSEAINSMFRWYQNAAKCYVYLADVSIRGWGREHDPEIDDTRTLIFQQRFTRGWTLQELLAPAIVEFFSAEGERLGDKKSLINQLQQVTQIARGALEGDPLSSFSVDERMAWTNKRKTKRDEDAAYCLFGLFDLHMPLLYGEGKKRAFIRLLREI